jgi:hypothetical protein
MDGDQSTDSAVSETRSARRSGATLAPGSSTDKGAWSADNRRKWEDDRPHYRDCQRWPGRVCLMTEYDCKRDRRNDKPDPDANEQHARALAAKRPELIGDPISRVMGVIQPGELNHGGVGEH